MPRKSGTIRLHAAALVLVLGTGFAVQAQTMQAPAGGIGTGPVMALGATSMRMNVAANAYDANRSSWLPYTRNGYIGLNLGRTRYQTFCGTFALRCERSNTSGRIYLGGFFNPYLGGEIAYTDIGSSQRAGGSTDARGINFSLVARAPVSSDFSIYGKLGTTYGRTRVSALGGSGVSSGSDNGWGPGYGLGASWDFSTNWSAVIEWDRQRFDFSGNDQRYVRSASVGLQYHF